MRNLGKIFAVVALLVLFGPLSFAGFARGAADTGGIDNSDSNLIPVDIGGVNVNFPVISVLVCTAGSASCQRIDNIKLDSGSVGLRIYKSALNLRLDAARDNNGNTFSVCQTYGGGSSMWGDVAIADVKLGEATAKAVRVQIVDDLAQPRPEACPFGRPTIHDDGANGQLGINISRIDGLGASYYSCSNTVCSSISPLVTERIQNPVKFLPRDNNGVTLVLPAVLPGGVEPVTGQLYLGVGTRADNAVTSAAVKCRPGADGFFLANLNGKTYWAMADTGTNAYDLPAQDSSFSHCSWPDGTQSPYLCPAPNSSMSVDFLNRDGSRCAQVRFDVSGFDLSAYRNGARVFAGLTEQWGGETSTTMNFGIPFFFGKRVSLVIDGAPSPLGPGPVVSW